MGLPTDALAELDIPVLNLGPRQGCPQEHGKDPPQVHSEVFPIFWRSVKKIIEKLGRNEDFSPGA